MYDKIQPVMQKPKGTRDFVGSESILREKITSLFIDFARNLGFTSIETPVFEKSELFERSVGKTSDIVQKELFYLSSKKNERFALRPELTAGVVRALIERGIKSMPKPINIYTVGNVYRYEKPQKGRYREFRQYDLNSFGEKNPYFDGYFIASAVKFIEKIINKKIVVYINSLGSGKTKELYAQTLLKTLKDNTDKLCDDCKSRITKNPLRVLDCKANCKDFFSDLITIDKFYTGDEKQYFKMVTDFLSTASIKFKIDPYLMRGLDYYTSIVFEFTVLDDTSRSSVLCGGGRFDNLVGNLGGSQTDAVGLGIGLERLLDNMKDIPDIKNKSLLIAPVSEDFVKKSYEICLSLISKGRSAQVSTTTNLQSSFSFALKNNFKKLIIVGDETASGRVAVKDLKSKSQKTVNLSGL